MRFAWVTINVKDFEKSIDFYTNVIGLTVQRKMSPMPGTSIAFLSNGETEVELIRNVKNNNPEYGNDISIGFEVESLDRTIDYLNKKGIEIQSGPFQPSPVIKFIYLLDPNGLKVQILQNLKG